MENILAKKIFKKIFIINVILHPHSPKTYINLFEEILNNKTKTKYRNYFYELKSFDKREENVYYGEFISFFDLSSEKHWINKNSLTEEKKESQEKHLENLPIRPQGKIYKFVFFPNVHKLLLISDDPVMFVDRLKEIIKQIRPEYSYEIIVRQKKESIAKILELNNIQKININIFRPNPDVMDEEPDFMEKENIEKMKLELIGKNLIITDKTQRLMTLALENGSITAKGLNEDNQKITISTNTIPLEFTEEMSNEDESSFISSIIEKCKEILGRII